MLSTRKRVWDPQFGYTSKKKKAGISTKDVVDEALNPLVSNQEGAPGLHEAQSNEPNHSFDINSSSDVNDNIFTTENFLDIGTQYFNSPFGTLNDYSWMFEENLFARNYPNSESSINGYVPLEPQNLDNSQQETRSVTTTISETGGFDNDYYAEYINPILDPATLQRLVKFIVRIATQDGICVLSLRDELLQPIVIQDCFHNYFSKFNIKYPMIHGFSFDPKTVDSMLLTSMILLGASHSSKTIHQQAVKIHDRLRGILFNSEHFSPTPELWVLQTLLLIEVFGNSRAGLKQYQLAHVFRGSLINLIRRSGYEDTVTEPYSIEDEKDLEGAWREWIHKESRKRITFMIFLWDVQYSCLFNQELSMSAFELKMNLPSHLSIWNSRNATEWLENRKREEKLLDFLPTLKLYLNCSGKPPKISSFSRILILHGLMSIAADMQKRDQISLNVQGDSIQWKLKLNKAYDFWYNDFTKYSRITLDHELANDQPHNESNQVASTHFSKFVVSTKALYHIAVMYLWTNFVDIQIFAGSKVLLSNVINESKYLASKKSITEWVSQIGTPDKSVTHAAQLLQDGLLELTDWDVHGETFNYSWCLYLSVITCYSFFKVLKDQDVKIGNSPTVSKTSTEPTKGDSKSALKRYVSAIIDGTSQDLRLMKNITDEDFIGTVDEIAEHLRTVRWAVTFDAYRVLKAIKENEF